MGFTFTPLALPEVILVEHPVMRDDRGFFTEVFRAEDFARAGLPPLVQDNHSRSARHVLRGLHYQIAPMAQGKLVRCLRGRLFDVAVDLRRDSPSFGRHVGIELSGDDSKMVWIPPGFAHGFLALEDGTELSYKTSAYYSPAHDRAVRWDDPAIGVDWPSRAVIVSAKDQAAPLLAEIDPDAGTG